MVLGGLVFAIWGVGGPAQPDERTIVVDQADVTRMVSVWRRQWRRPPTPSELEGLVDSHIREEILYREALALGLDRDDSIVRRRMNQKMEFLAEDLATQDSPTEDQLESFLRDHPDKFRQPPILTLEHVFFSNDGADPEHRAVAALESLESERSAERPGGGDRFILGDRQVRKTPDQLMQIFGRAFTLAVADLEPGSWRGPIHSGYGVHLVRITERIDSDAPILEDVKEQVRTEYLRSQRIQANEATFLAMRARYNVVLDFGDPPEVTDKPSSSTP